MDRLLNVREVAELLGLKKSTIYAWVNQDYIPYCKIGRFLKFREKTIEAWVKSQETKGRKKRVIIDSHHAVGYSMK